MGNRVLLISLLFLAPYGEGFSAHAAGNEVYSAIEEGASPEIVQMDAPRSIAIPEEKARQSRKKGLKRRLLSIEEELKALHAELDSPESTQTRKSSTPGVQVEEQFVGSSQNSSQKATLRKKSPRTFDPVPSDHIESIAGRLLIVEEILRKYGRAYDYRSHTTNELQRILTKLDRAAADQLFTEGE